MSDYIIGAARSARVRCIMLYLTPASSSLKKIRSQGNAFTFLEWLHQDININHSFYSFEVQSAMTRLKTQLGESPGYSFGCWSGFSSFPKLAKFFKKLILVC